MWLGTVMQRAKAARQSGDRASKQAPVGVADEIAQGSSGELLPFPKRRATNEEVDLTDDDLVEVTDEESAPRVPAASVPAPRHVSASSPSASSQSRSQARAAAAAARRPTRSAYASALPPGSRRVLDEGVEEDVAGQCLASIAAATSAESSRHLRSSGGVRVGREAVLATPVAQPAHADSRTSRLPSITAPPFVRATTTTSTSPIQAAAVRAPEAPGIRDSAPPAAFVRRSSPALASPVSSAASSATLPPAASSRSGVGSVAPVSMASVAQASQEPTVILVRERPRSIWIVAAAAVGAIAAIAAMRFAPSVPGERTTTVEPPAAAAPPAAPLPATAVAVPVASPASTGSVVAAAPAAASAAVAPGSASAATPPGAVMHFADDEGVAIKAPAPAPRRPSVSAPAVGAPAAPAARPAGQAPRPPSMGPALPDGSFGLGRSETATAAAPSPPPSLTATAPSSPEPPRKRALTPEQQLAEAQLKASMK
jgi:hypothetical protein